MANMVCSAAACDAREGVIRWATRGRAFCAGRFSCEKINLVIKMDSENKFRRRDWLVLAGPGYFEETRSTHRSHTGTFLVCLCCKMTSFQVASEVGFLFFYIRAVFSFGSASTSDSSDSIARSSYWRVRCRVNVSSRCCSSHSWCS